MFRFTDSVICEDSFAPQVVGSDLVESSDEYWNDNESVSISSLALPAM